MPLVDLYGHEEIRALLASSAKAGKLPGSILFRGPYGVGKQRLALWLGQLLLCTDDDKPCGHCKGCKYSRNLTHPDLHWYFPRPRLKDADPSLADVVDDYQEAIAERLANGGLYAAPPGNDGIFVATVRAIVQQASMSPAMATKKVFIIGDAERMVPQEGAEFAANAFLKLLEEPSAKTTLILTSSEPGGLLPTIRSRAVSIRVPPLTASAMRAFLADPIVSAALEKAGAPKSAAERMALASGAPGHLFGDESRGRSIAAARKLMDAALAKNESARHAAAMAVGGSGARGSFTDTLDAMLVLIAERMRSALHDSDEARALGASRAVDAVARARELAGGNVNPQLITAQLLHQLATILA
jgi:DNA polymerase-3 subunit delta'